MLAPVRVLPLGAHRVQLLCGAPAGPRVAAALSPQAKENPDLGRRASRLVVCEASDPAPLARFKRHGLTGLAFTQAGAGLLALGRASLGLLLVQLDLATGLAAEPWALPYDACLAPDGRLVACRRPLGQSTTYEEDRTYELVVMDVASRATRWRGEFDGFEVGGLAPVAFPAGAHALFRSGASHLLVALETGTARWLRDGPPLVQPVYSPDGACVVDRLTPAAGLVALGLAGLKAPRPLQGTGARTWLVTFAPAGDRVLVADATAGLGLWDPASGERVLTLDPGRPTTTLTCAAFGDGGRLLYLGTTDGKVLVFELAAR